MIETLEGTSRFLVTRRIVPYGQAQLFDELPVQLRDTISEVHYVDGSHPDNKGLVGTYGIDLPPRLAAKFEKATNLIDLIDLAEHGMGRHDDPRREQLLQAAPLEAALEQLDVAPVGEVAPRRWAPGVTLDQGREGSCVGHGCRHFVNGEPVMTPPNEGPTAVDLYKWAQRNDPWPGEDYSGTSVEAGLEALLAHGYIKAVGYTQSYDSFIRWLSEQGGLVIGWDWYEGMHRTNPAGYITPTGRLTGGHCVWINELLPDRAGIGGQNSWGGGWGINGGFFKLALEDLKKLMSGRHAVAGAVTQIAPVAPEPEPEPPKPEPPKPEYREMWVSDFCNQATKPLLGQKLRLRSKHGPGWRCDPV